MCENYAENMNFHVCLRFVFPNNIEMAARV